MTTTQHSDEEVAVKLRQIVEGTREMAREPSWTGRNELGRLTEAGRDSTGIREEK